MPAGRPPKYTKAEQLQEKIDAYYADCERREVPYTIEGLANACDMVRDTLLEYSKQDEFSDTIKRAKQKVYQQMTEGLLAKGTSGYIFYVKNNIPGYEDKSTTKHEGGISMEGLLDYKDKKQKKDEE